MDLVANDPEWDLTASRVFGVGRKKLLGVFEDSILITNGDSIQLVQGPRQIVGWPVAPHQAETLAQGESNILLVNRFESFQGSIFGANRDGTQFQGLDLLSPLSLERTGVYAGPSFYYFASETHGGPNAIYRSDGTKQGTERLLGFDELPAFPEHLVASSGVAYFLTQSTVGLQIWAIQEEWPAPRVVVSMPDVFRSSPTLSAVAGNFVLSYAQGTLIGNSQGEAILDVDDFWVEVIHEGEVVLRKLGHGVSPRFWITDQLQLTATKTIDVESARNFTSIDGKLFFTTPGATWESDGTSDGTEMVSAREREVLHADEHFVYFSDHDAEHGVELWRAKRSTLNRSDFNQDGVVDFVDFLIVSRNFGKRGEFQTGDADGSGRIDFRDFLLVSQLFMRPPSSLVGE